MFQAKFSQFSDSRRNNFDFLRFLFASLVMVNHGYLLLQYHEHPEPLSWAMDGRTNFGVWSVACFFSISGFLISQSWERSRGVGDFLRKRVPADLPRVDRQPPLLCLLVAPFSRANHQLHLQDPATRQYFLPLALHPAPVGLPGVFLCNPFPVWVNGSLWTIPWEFVCYLMVAALGLAGAFRSRPVTLALFMALLAYNLGPGHPHNISWGDRTVNVPYFGNVMALFGLAAPYLGGVLLYLYRDVVPRSRALAVGALAALVLLAWWPPLSLCWPLAYPIFNCYLLFYVAYSSRLALHDFGRRGDLSYGVYLYGFPIQQTLIQHIQHMGYALTPLTLSLTAWPLACFFAMLSWRCIEKPFLKLKAKPRLAPPDHRDALPAVAAPVAQDSTPA